MAHDFEEKRIDILKEISNEKNIINYEEDLEQIADVLINLEIEVKNEKKSLLKKDIIEGDMTTSKYCKHYQQGYCKNGSKCQLSHQASDCKSYILDGKCDNNSCRKRHRKVCRYWKQEFGYKRGSKCAYLHRKVTKSTAENDFSFTDMNPFFEEKNQIIEDLKSDVDELMEDQRESITHYKEACTEAFKKLKEVKVIMTELENVNESLRDENIQLIKEVQLLDGDIDE